MEQVLMAHGQGQAGQATGHGLARAREDAIARNGRDEAGLPAGRNGVGRGHSARAAVPET